MRRETDMIEIIVPFVLCMVVYFIGVFVGIKSERMKNGK